MNPDHKLLHMQPRQGKLEDIERGRVSLKNLLDDNLKNLNYDQIKALISNINAIEDLFFGGMHLPEERPNLPGFRGKGRVHLELINRDELRKTIFGMVNVMPLENIRKFLANPNPLNVLFKDGNLKYRRPKNRKSRASTVSKEHSASGVPLQVSGENVPAPKTEIIYKEPRHESRFMKDIQRVAITGFQHFNWEDKLHLLYNIHTFFVNAGLQVKTRSLFPDNQDYIVVSDNSLYPEGIVVIKPGTILDVKTTFNLFGGSNPGQQVSPSNIIAFPEVEKPDTGLNFTDTPWRVIKHGVLRK